MESQIAPLRPLEDFLFTFNRFGKPDFNNAEKWFNRIVSNLLYYQTNYFVSVIILFAIFTVMNVQSVIVGVTMCVVLSYTFKSLFHSSSPLNFKDPKTLSCIAFLFLLTVFQPRHVLRFLLGVSIPLALVVLHSSFRLRNVKNKIANVAEALGMTQKTPMGILLESMGIEVDLKYIS